MSSLEYPIIWPPLSEEIKPFLKYCKGLVLNAGSGRRELGLGERELNIDIVPDNEPDIIGDLHSIPLIDQAVDTVVSIAVLEHTRFPWIVVQEFHRILKPGGYGVIAVPFIQPQHACPDDYCRFTENGLIELSKYIGFEVIETAHVHHFGQTIAWLLWEYLQENMPQNKLLLRFWFWLIRQLSSGKLLGSDSSNTHNTHYIVVRKPGTTQTTSEAKALLANRSINWFFPLLLCPNSRQPLYLKDNYLVSEGDQFTYAITDQRPTLLPHTDPRTWKTEVTRPDAIRLGVNGSEITSSSRSQESLASLSTSDSSSGENKESDDMTTLVTHHPGFRFSSKQAFEVSFKSPFAEQLIQANPRKIAVLATNEYEGIFKNGGIGTHYKTLSDQLAQNGWHVVLFLCTYDRGYGGTSSVEAVKNTFSIREIDEVLNLQPIHQAMLGSFSSEWKYWIDHQSFSCLLFTQAISTLFKDLPIYIEFHEMSGIGYHTIQAKQSRLLGSNCVIGVTMHSGHEWIYEANEWFAEEYLPYYQQACNYEQFSFENANLTFFPSHYLRQKVESYGWQTSHAQHMPYFIPILRQSSSLQAGPNDNAVEAAVFNHPQSKVPVIFFGRMEMRKGIMTVVEAIKLLSLGIRAQIHVHFVGKVVRLHASKFGDLESDRYIQQELEGQVDYTIHPDFYSHQAIRFISSLRSPIVCLASHQENFPNTGLEMGQIPSSLVVSDTGGFRETLEFVHREAGIYWFKPADPFALSDMLSKAFFNYPEVPAVPTVEGLEEINRQLWDRKLSFIEAALSQQSAYVVDRPKVTVGIVCCNSGKSLMDCLISIETQTYDNLEIIVLDNASSDLETQQVIEQAKIIFKTYKFVRIDNYLGLGAARNYLIEFTEGDYFLPLDAKYRLMPFAIETFVTAGSQSLAEVVISPSIVFGAEPALDITARCSSIPAMLQMNTLNDVCALFSTNFLRKFQQPERLDCSTQNLCTLSAAIATGSKLVYSPYPLYESYLGPDKTIQAESLSKERYYLRQYLAQIAPSDWSSRQINMMLLAIQEQDVQQEKLKLQAQQAQAETQRVQAELLEVKQKLQKARGSVRGMRERLERTEVELQNSKDRVSAIETSKFWKIRKGWFKVKKLLNLPSNE